MFFVIIFFLVIPNGGWASIIKFSDNNVYVIDWIEKRSVHGNDLSVVSNIYLSVSELALQKSNNITISIYNGESEYLPSENDRKKENFMLIVKEDGRTLKENESLVEVIENRRYVTHKKITIMLPNKIDHWVDYELNFNYTLSDFVKEVGDSKYFFIRKQCIFIGNSKNNCGSSADTSISFLEKDVLIEDCQICTEDTKNGKKRSSKTYLYIEKLHEDYKIIFKDIDDIEENKFIEWILNNFVVAFIVGVFVTRICGYYLGAEDCRKLKKLNNIFSGKDKVDGIGKITLDKLRKKIGM